MGRNKILIQKIKVPRIRNISFCKRKKGLLKKAMELCFLCDVDICLCIYNKQIPSEQMTLFCSDNRIDYFIDNYIRNPLINKEIYGLKDVRYNIFIFNLVWFYV